MIRPRTPRYRAFAGTGVAVGLVLAVVLGRFLPPGAAVSTRTALAYLAVFLGAVGALLGLGVAVLLERGQPPPPSDSPRSPPTLDE